MGLERAQGIQGGEAGGEVLLDLRVLVTRHDARIAIEFDVNRDAGIVGHPLPGPRQAAKANLKVRRDDYVEPISARPRHLPHLISYTRLDRSSQFASNRCKLKLLRCGPARTERDVEEDGDMDCTSDEKRAPFGRHWRNVVAIRRRGTTRRRARIVVGGSS